MKVEIIKRKHDTSKIKFPCVGVSGVGGIVIFADEKTGLSLYDNNGEVSVFWSADYWDMDAFTLYPNAKIEIVLGEPQ